MKTVPERGIGHWLHHRGIRRVLLLVRIPVGLAVGVALVWLAQPTWFWAAAGVAFAGELLQMWAAACLEKRKVFLPRGPYTLVRNPMYMGRFLVILGALGVLANPWVLLAFVLGFVPYVVGRVLREEKSLPEFFGEPYRAYAASVPRFLPFRLRPYRAGGPLWFFSWRMLVENREHLNLMAVVSFFLVVGLRIALA